jgi:hypothetical protein
MMALTKAHNRMIAGAQTNVLDYGAVGDGVTDDSAAIQAAINAGQHIYIPEGTYLLSTPISFIARNQIISGDGMWQTVLLGQVQIGDGDVIVPNIRRCQLHHIQVDDDGRYDYAVEINKSRDTRIEHCNISGIRQNSSVSCFILNNRIGRGLGDWAYLSKDYSNGSVISNNIITGGSGAGAINVRGPMTVGTINSNVIESSLHGIWIASEAVVSTGDAGACTSISLRGNYIEQCSTPYKIAKIFTVTALRLENSYIGNSSISVVPARTAAFDLGRLRNSNIVNCNVALFEDTGTPANSEKLFEVGVVTATSMDFNQNYIAQVLYSDLSSNWDPIEITGAYAASLSFVRAIGGTNFFDLAGFEEVSNNKYPGLSSSESRIYVSREFAANVTVSSLAWQLGTELSFGGSITKIDIVEANGTLTGCRLRVGDTGDIDRILDIADLSAVSFTNGTHVTTAEGPIFGGSGSDPNIISVTAGGGTGTFRVRITFRAT